MDLLIGIISIAVSIIFGIVASLYSKRQLAEAKKQNANTQEKLTQTEKELKETEGELDLLKGGLPHDIELLGNVHDALLKLNKVIDKNAKLNGRVEVQIFGLDLQTIIPWFMTKFIQSDDYKDVHLSFRLMMINPDIKAVKPLIDGSSNISRDAVQNAIKRAKSIYEDKRVDRLEFEMRKYNHLPIIHGYLVDKQHLGLAFTQLENGKIYGGRYQYICCSKDNISTFKTHLFGVYETWFEYYWSTGTQIVKIKK